MSDPHIQAVELALAGEWDDAHRIVQDLNDPVACWIHAVLHKIEGDEWNSRYWYARSGGQRYEDAGDPRAELEEVRAVLARG
jgi:hypothetical protein